MFFSDLTTEILNWNVCIEIVNFGTGDSKNIWNNKQTGGPNNQGGWEFKN